LVVSQTALTSVAGGPDENNPVVPVKNKISRENILYIVELAIVVIILSPFAADAN
jgi:hypothetical protein